MRLKYDRDELYPKVWERPMLKVAEEYGVSDVALARVCRKLSVPLPGRGYWAKLAHGHAVQKRPPLPTLKEVPVIYRSEHSEQKLANASRSDDPEMAAIETQLKSGTFEPHPLDPDAQAHALIRKTASRLRGQSQKMSNEILVPREPGGLDVKVTAGALDRALNVMAQILTVLEQRGIKIEVLEQDVTAAFVDGQKICFGIAEPIRRVVTQNARVPNPSDKWDYDQVVTFEPSGTLALSIHNTTWSASGLRKKWGDTQRHPIEEVIPDFIAGLMRTAVVVRREEEARLRQEQERQRKEQERAELRVQIDEEEKKLKQFEEWLENWDKAEQMRRFIAVYAEKSLSWAPEKQQKYREWAEWAAKQADRLDPFVEDRPQSVLDRKHELRWY